MRQLRCPFIAMSQCILKYNILFNNSLYYCFYFYLKYYMKEKNECWENILML